MLLTNISYINTKKENKNKKTAKELNIGVILRI